MGFDVRDQYDAFDGISKWYRIDASPKINTFCAASFVCECSAKTLEILDEDYLTRPDECTAECEWYSSDPADLMPEI